MLSKTDLLIVVIHNQDEKRNSHVLPNARSLAAVFDGKVLEIFEQPKIDPLSVSFSLLRDLRRWRLERAWRRYRLERVRPFILDAIKSLPTILRRYIGKDSLKLRWKASIEMVVANKHVQAWQHCLSSARFVLILEDDAIFLNNSEKNLVELLKRLIDEDDSSPMYFDLAGGLSLETLGLSKIIKSSDGNSVEFLYPVTNTACAYLLNKSLAQYFCDTMNQSAYFKDAPIDWLMNGIFVRLHEIGIKARCVHMAPALLQHGSFTGAYKTWQD